MVMLQTHLVQKLKVSVVMRHHFVALTVVSTWLLMPAGQESPAKGVAPIYLMLSVSAAGDSGDSVDPFGTKVSAVYQTKCL